MSERYRCRSDRKIKGSAANLSAEILQKIFADIEKNCRNWTSEIVAKQITSLDEQLALVLNDMQKCQQRLFPQSPPTGGNSS